MKTFDYPIKDLLNKGLRPLEESPRNGMFMTAVENARVTEGGLAGADKLTRTAFGLNETAQIFTAYTGVYVLTDDTLYSWSAPTLTQLLTGLATGGEWSMADFGSYVLFTNGSVNLIRDPITGTFASDAGVIFPLAISLCAHRGRLILGGPANYPNSEDINTNWVAWSDINNLDFLHTPLLTTTISILATQVSFTLTAGSANDDTYNNMIAVITDAGDSSVKAFAPILDYTGSTKTITLNVDPAIFTMAATDEVKIYEDVDQDQARQNLAGYIPMPWEGNVQRVEPFQDKIVVYGDNGVTALKLLSTELVPSTYGLLHLSSDGIKEQAAMTDNNQKEVGTEHYFIDTEGYVVAIDENMKVERIGYKELFASASDIRLSYNPVREQVFFKVSSVLTYILSKQGMTAISAGIDSLAYRMDTLLIHSVAAIAQTNLTLSTDVINFNTFGLKALEWVSFNVDCPDDIYVTVRYRDSVQDSYSSARRKQLNSSGVCRLGVRGVDFILDFDIPNYTSIQLASMVLSVQFVDRRFRRGTQGEM